MTISWLNFINALNYRLKYKEYFKLDKNEFKNINTGDLDDKLNFFCFIFELSTNSLNAFFKSKYDIKFDPINENDKII